MPQAGRQDGAGSLEAGAVDAAAQHAVPAFRLHAPAGAVVVGIGDQRPQLAPAPDLLGAVGEAEYRDAQHVDRDVDGDLHHRVVAAAREIGRTAWRARVGTYG